ncbi:uncharacterized protein [Temnothorax longispinosus]|uniref:uncharacterized protein isoform X2 n=1 Tax=Temnothorax longispinosus TaxID=300112 RepID=UPI003A9A07B1
MPKDFQLLSKGQKDQLIQIELNRYKDSKLLLHSTPLNISSNLLDKAEIVSISSDSTSCGSHTSPSYVNEINELSIESQFETQNNEEQDIEIKYNVSEVTNVSDCTNNITLRDDLQTFIIDCNIAHDAASDLLTILRKHGHVDLPKDVRLLFQNQQCWRPRTVNGANCTSLELARKSTVNLNDMTTDEGRLGQRKRQHIVYSDSEEEQHNCQCRKHIKRKQINVSSVTTVPSCPSNVQIKNKYVNVPQVATFNDASGNIINAFTENNPVPSTFNERLHSEISNMPIIVEGYEQLTGTVQDSNIKEKLDQILRMQAATNISLRNINQRLYKIEDAIKHKSTKSPVEINDNLIAPFLPLKTIEEIKQFECLLRTSNEPVTQFKQFVSKTGGNNAKDHIYKCLKKLITNECAMKCSWKGFRNNFQISNLYSMKIMKKEITSHYTCTESDFDNTTAEWLRFANQRNKRENQAKENNAKCNECNEDNEY